MNKAFDRLMIFLACLCGSAIPRAMDRESTIRDGQKAGGHQKDTEQAAAKLVLAAEGGGIH